MFYIYLGIILYFFYRILFYKDKQQEVLLACAYMVGSEVFFRMTKANIFWETGKYSVIVFSLMGIFYLGLKRKAAPYLLYFILLLPAISVSYGQLSFDMDFRRSVIFNLSGPFCLCVAALFTYGRTLSLKKMLEVLDYIVYPIIAMTVYIILYSPDVAEAIKNTGSNANVSGGYSGNQVATILGLGFFILMSRFFIPYKNMVLQGVMMFFMVLMGYRALITFSRGGVIVAVVMVIAFIVVYHLRNPIEDKFRTGVKFAGILLGALALWGFTHAQTNGLIENRYTNKDALGRVKDDVTTGRAKLFEAELDAFVENPLLGLGAGRVKVHFEEELDIRIATHNEISRTLAEHGVLGIFALMTLMLVPLLTLLQGRQNFYFWPFYIFWILTVSHSSMRIAAPAFVYALCLLNIQYASKKNPLRRKSVKRPREVSNFR